MNLDHKAPSIQELNTAVALGYDGNTAPTLLAKGDAELAEQILAIAREHNIPICENPALAKLLSLLEVGDHIPKELYVAVAHILAFAYRMDNPNYSPTS